MSIQHGRPTGHGRPPRPRTRTLPLIAIQPSPENDELYRPVNPADPCIVALADSIREFGLREPIIVSADRFIISGHRRHTAAKLAGLTHLSCRIDPVRRDGDPDAFVRLLREHNRQRDKTIDEKLREEIVSTNPKAAHRRLIQYRQDRLRQIETEVQIRGVMRRCKITAAKRPFLAAILAVLGENADYWPLSLRQLHYYLLNDPPLRHASKRDSTYRNDRESYKSLIDLATRARLAGEIHPDAIDDETRPTTTWKVYRDPRQFIREHLDQLFAGYYRDLQVNQPYHVELAAEKLTVRSILHPVASEFTVPMTMGRGYTSIPARQKMLDRFEKSGKDKLLIVCVSDCDPDGEDLADLWGRSLRDDFGVTPILTRPALTREQAAELELPRNTLAKETSSRTKGYVERHGDDAVWELEAIPPATLQRLVRDGLLAAMDKDALSEANRQEQADAQYLDGCRQRANLALRDVVSGGDE